MKKIKDSIVNWLKPHTNKLRWVSILFTLFAFVALACWLFELKCKFRICDINWEALFATLTLIATGINQAHRWLLSEAQYSPATALAHGYVNNFLDPLITQLQENGEKDFSITVYTPEDISELFANNVDRIKSTIKEKNFQINEIQMNIKHGRARDILIVEKSKTKKVYFDFPNTLTSLIGFIEYSVASRKNESMDKQKQELGKELINKFLFEVNALLVKRHLDKYVNYCDHNLNFCF